MTKETEVALAAIDALCSKRKAKALRKLVLKAVESERTLTNPFITYTDGTHTNPFITYTDGTPPSVSTTDITWTGA